MSITFYPNYIHLAGFDAAVEPSITTQGYTRSDGETSGAVFDLVDNCNNTLVTIDTNAETTNFNIDLDLSANITAADFAIIDNHNFETASCDFYVKYGGTTQALTAAYSGILGTELTSETLSANLVIEATDGICLCDFNGTRTSQNWEFVCSYNDVQFTADVTAGEIGIGVSFSPSKNPDRVIRYDANYGTVLNESRSGARHGIKTHGLRRGWTLSWADLTASDIASLLTIFGVTNGRAYPFWIDLGEGTNYPLLYYVRFASNLRYEKQTTGVYTASISFEEEI